MNLLKKICNNPITILICRFVIAYIFITFAIDKISNPADFAKQIANYEIAPVWSYNIIALTLPWVEIFVGILLLMGVELKANAILTAAMLIMFIFMVSVAWAKGLDINCGCSAAHPMQVGLPKILENTGLLLMTAMIWYFPRKEWTLGNV